RGWRRLGFAAGAKQQRQGYRQPDTAARPGPLHRGAPAAARKRRGLFNETLPAATVATPIGGRAI
ncbi:MAG: hypothetical protein OSA97_19430, partial [Nevskia sp.]|nr:hypothetical protein [Nevskia sp.]